MSEEIKPAAPLTNAAPATDRIAQRKREAAVTPESPDQAVIVQPENQRRQVRNTPGDLRRLVRAESLAIDLAGRIVRQPQQAGEAHVLDTRVLNLLH